MKKIAVLIFATIYLIPSIGFSMDVHFCGDKISGISLKLSQAEKCECGKKAASKCCKEVKVSVKLTDSQKISIQSCSYKLISTAIISFPENGVIKGVISARIDFIHPFIPPHGILSGIAFRSLLI